MGHGSWVLSAKNRQSVLQLFDETELATGEPAFGRLGNEAFDGIEPGGTCRR